MPESLYHYIWQVSRRGQINLCVLSALTLPLAMAPLELQRRIVNSAIGGREVELLIGLALAYLAVLVVRGGLRFWVNYYRGLIGECVIRDLRDMVYRCTFMIDPGGKRRRPKAPEEVDRGAVVSMVAAEVETLGGFVGEGFSFPLMQAGTMAVIVGYFLWIEPIIAMIAAILYSPQFYLVPLTQRTINRHVKARAEIVRELGDFVVQEAKFEGVDAKTPPAFARLLGRVYALRLKIYRLKFLLKGFNNFLSAIGPLGVLAFGGYLVIEGRTDLGTVVAFMSGLERLTEPWRELMGFYRRISEARVKYKLLVDTFPPMPQAA